MASILPGYEYDIFLSYRQKDNRSDQWVTNFVKALKEELDATFKEDVSIYFDSNPHDGLLETHDVDASLKEKIKCLVFIPIVSRTYCDPKSFAWKNEFIAFRDFVYTDPNGMDIKLMDGNVAKRVLPVRIHDIDKEDASLLEKEIGGVLRPVDFIYKEPGVNRPLRISDERSLNLEKTDYKNQVNKVANAAQEIIRGLGTEDRYKPSQSQHDRKVILPNHSIQTSRSIVVLPFENISNDPEQDYFSDGLTDELITDLSKIRSLKVISRNSCMMLKGMKKSTQELSRELNVRYILQGGVRKAGDNLRVTAQLADALDDTLIWAEKYNKKVEDIFNIQESISRSIVDALTISLNRDEDKKLVEKPIANVRAYQKYLQAIHESGKYSKESSEHAIQFLEESLAIEGDNALLYTALGYAYELYKDLDVTNRKPHAEKVRACALKAIELDPELASAYGLLGISQMDQFKANYKEGIKNLMKALEINPHDAEALRWSNFWFANSGNMKAADEATVTLREIDPLNPMSHFWFGWNHFMNGRFGSAVKEYEICEKLSPGQTFLLLKAMMLAFDQREDEVLAISIPEDQAAIPPWNMISALQCAIRKDLTSLNRIVQHMEEIQVESDNRSGWWIAEFYAIANDLPNTMKWLEIAMQGGWINYTFFSEHDVMIKKFRGNSPFDSLLGKMKMLRDELWGN